MIQSVPPRRSAWVSPFAIANLRANGLLASGQSPLDNDIGNLASLAAFQFSMRAF